MNKQTQKLLLALFFDAIGMLSFTIPFIGEFSDVVWAPLSGYLMTQMYKGRLGRVAGVIEFAEEFLPFTDYLPTFTLTWIYYYKIKKLY